MGACLPHQLTVGVSDMVISRSFTVLVLAVFAAAAIPAQSFAVAGSNGEYGYEKGLYYESGDGKFKIKQNFRIQFRADVENTNENDEDAVTDFMIRRLKLKFGGHAYEKWLKWEFQLAGSAGREDRDEDLSVEDAFIVIAKQEWSDVKVGRHKFSYGRESLNSSSTLQFVDRSIAREFGVGASRADGISFGGILGNLIAYRTGLFQLGNNKFKDLRNMLAAGRVQVNVCCGELKYSSGGFTAGGDYKISPNFAGKTAIAFGAGGYYYYGERSDAVNVFFLPAAGAVLVGRSSTPDDNRHYGVTADFAAKFSRWNLEAAFYYFNEREFESRDADLGADGVVGGTGANADTEGAAGLRYYNNYAYRVQGGFFVLPSVEIATRYAGKSFDSDSSENDEWAWTSGVNYYIAKHRVKIQLDYTYGAEKNALNGGDLEKNIFRAQFQVYL